MTDTIAYLIVWTFVALGCMYAIYTISPPKKLIVALTLIAASIAAPIYVYNPLMDSLGFAVKLEKIDNVEFLHYTVDSSQTWIYLWVIDDVSGEPRSYKIPYTQEDEKELSKAAQQGQEGVPQGISVDFESTEVSDSTDTAVETEPLSLDGGDK